MRTINRVLGIPRFTYSLLQKALEAKGRPVDMDEILEQVSGKYFVLLDEIKSGLQFLERKGLIKKEFDARKKKYFFDLRKRGMNGSDILRNHTDVFESSVLE